jgi:hypothetical protein
MHSISLYFDGKLSFLWRKIYAIGKYLKIIAGYVQQLFTSSDCNAEKNEQNIYRKSTKSLLLACVLSILLMHVQEAAFVIFLEIHILKTLHRFIGFKKFISGSWVIQP